MKQRVISSLVGLLLLAIVIFLFDTIFLNIIMIIISLIAVHELLNAMELSKYYGLVGISIGFSLLLPFIKSISNRKIIPLLVLVLVVLFFICVIRYHSKLRFEQMATALMMSIYVPLFFSSAVYFRDDLGVNQGIYYLSLSLGSAWFSDTGAFFAGMFFGKHKLAPVISPKKTIEGAIGGLVCATALNLLMAVIFNKFVGLNVNLLIVGIISPLLASMGIIGDLIASIIKRQHNVKDYGHIMPGHGGVMDRFDSALLTLPTVYVLSHILKIITN